MNTMTPAPTVDRVSIRVRGRHIHWSSRVTYPCGETVVFSMDSQLGKRRALQSAASACAVSLMYGLRALHEAA